MSALTHLDIQLTHACNLACAYCYARKGGGETLPPDLPVSLARGAVEFLFHESGSKRSISIDLWGGEPFLRPDLIEAVAAHARMLSGRTGKSVTIVVPTNATLLTDENCRLVAQRNLRLSLSLDGGRDAFEQRRTASGGNPWPVIEEGLGRLRKCCRGRLPPVRMTITPKRSGSFFTDLSALLDRGFRQIAFQTASGVTWTATHQKQLKRELGKAVDHFAAWIRDRRPDPPYYSSLLRRLTSLWVEETTGVFPPRSGNCGAGSLQLAVQTDGLLYPCHRFVARADAPPELRLGTLAEGITNAALVEQLKTLSMDRPPIRCASCPDRRLCAALCPALNYEDAGSVAIVPAEACRINRTLGRAAAKIHQALHNSSAYRRYLEPFLYADPDERMLPLLSALERDTEGILDAIAARLPGAGRQGKKE